MLINMHTREAALGRSCAAVSLSHTGVIKVSRERRIELPPPHDPPSSSTFTVLFEIKPEVSSTHNDNASALTTVETWLHSCMKIQQKSIVLTNTTSKQQQQQHGVMNITLIQPPDIYIIKLCLQWDVPVCLQLI